MDGVKTRGPAARPAVSGSTETKEAKPAPAPAKTAEPTTAKSAGWAGKGTPQPKEGQVGNTPIPLTPVAKPVNPLPPPPAIESRLPADWQKARSIETPRGQSSVGAPISSPTDLIPQGTPKNIDEAFDTLVSSASGPAQVRRATDNVQAWNMKWDLVTKATKTFDFSYFSVERDAYGHAYMGALLAQQLRGVQVTGVTDWMANSRGHGFAGTGLGADYMQELAQYGAKVGLYNAPGTRAESIVKDGLTYKAISSDHDKLCVADAGTPQAEGETGGRNVARAYHQDVKDNPQSWRDDSIQIKGPVTSGLVEALHREMSGPAVKMVKPDLININEHATEMLGSFQLMENWIKGKPLTEAEKTAIRADPKKKEALANELYAQAVAAVKTMPGIPDKIRNKELTSGEKKILREQAAELAGDLELKGSRQTYDKMGGFIEGEVKILDQVGAASAKVGERFNELGPDLFHLIQGAQKEIVIQNPYVVLTEPMVQALEDASQRGVNITIVTNSPESTDSAVTQGFFLNDWKQFESRVPSARIFVATGERKFHSKTFVLDGKVSGDTSYNADLLSGLVNGEVGAVTKSEAVAQDLLGAIHDDLANPANKFKEWTIKRDADGKPVLGSDGQPIAVEGPETTVSAKLLKRYKPMQFLCDLLSKTTLGAPLSHPPVIGTTPK